MTYIASSGDLFATTTLRNFAHGCNCAGSMGKGIAVAFKRRWPQMFKEYKARCADGRLVVGGVFTYASETEVVFNLGTQAHWRAKKGGPAADLGGIESACRQMVTEAEERGLDVVALPVVGAGLGGLSTGDVVNLLQDVFGPSSVEFWVVERFVAGEPLTRFR